MIIGLLGFAQVGKDTVGNIICKEGAQKIGFADALKRMCIDVFDFTEEQMWGTIEQKETIDLRYPREEHTWDRRTTLEGARCLCCGMLRSIWMTAPLHCYLTPRYAMKIMGTEGGRHCWDGIWIKKAIDAAKKIGEGYLYNKTHGAFLSGEIRRTVMPTNAVFIDNRFINEVKAIWEAGGRVFRIKRPGFDKPLFDHASETEQLLIPDDKLNGIIMNDGTLEDLREKVCELLRK